MSSTLVRKPLQPCCRDCPRLPFEPLRAWVNRGREESPIDNSELARLLLTTRESVRRWAVNGMPVYIADEVAIRAGVHPMVLWPDWCDLADIDNEAEARLADLEASQPQLALEPDEAAIARSAAARKAWETRRATAAA